MEYKVLELENGLRFIVKHTNRPVSHFAVIINTGTRDEKVNEHGAAHLLEHMLFKGTKKRKAYHIISRLEDVGGEIDAFTTKEETCIHASFLEKHTERTVELIGDILFNSAFPEKEVEREKTVILEEINSYRDNPAELIFDDFEELVFDGHSLGRNILGCEKTLKNLHQGEIRDFAKRTYNTNQIVFCAVTKTNPDILFRYFRKYFGHYPANPRKWKRKAAHTVKPSEKVMKKNTHQAHCVMGFNAFNFSDENRLPLLLLTNMLGGPGIKSRLNYSLREKHALAYFVDAAFVPYSDTGFFSIYFGSDKDKVNKALQIIRNEIENLRNHEIGKQQLHKAKQQLIGQIAISLENPEALLLNICKSYLNYGRVDSLKVVNENINKITSEQLRGISEKIFDFNKVYRLLYL